MIKYILIIVLSITFFTNAQSSQQESINLGLGYGLHGSGDLYGYQYGVQYTKDFGKKWTWSIELGGSLHDGADDTLTYLDESGTLVDATLHFVVGGLQTGFGVTYNVIKNENHRLGLTVMPILRYQATSLSDLIATLSPGFTDLPFPVRNLIRLEPARTFSLGSVFRFEYAYHLGNDFHLGLGASFQMDTNEDTILSGLISFGKRF